MKVEYDFSELTKFASRLQAAYEFDSALMAATRQVAEVLHQNLLVQTPVKTGNLRKMWSAGDNLLFTVEKRDGGYEVTFVNKARSGKDAKSDDESTGFMYGVAVNDGHRTVSGGWVMGRFFVENAIIQTANSSKLETIIMKELKKWWESCLNG